MKPKETFLGQPIRSLQTMLRVLAENDDAYKPLIPWRLCESSNAYTVCPLPESQIC